MQKKKTTKKKIAPKKVAKKTKKPLSVEKRNAIFQKLSPEKKRIAIAEDVLERLRVKQINPTQGKFCAIDFSFESGTPSDDTSLQEIVGKRKNTCQACAKGALFVSMVGFVNKFTIGDLTDGTNLWGVVRGNRLNSKEMKKLGKYFSKKQLTLIETTFEGEEFDFNVKLTKAEHEKCKEFYNKHYLPKFSDKAVLRAICKNIIKNNGEFKP